MQEMKTDYRGHLIFTHASGPPSGPFVAAFTTWLFDEPTNSYRAKTQGALTGIVFPTKDEALQAAGGAAKGSIDSLMGP